MLLSLPVLLPVLAWLGFSVGLCFRLCLSGEDEIGIGVAAREANLLDITLRHPDTVKGIGFGLGLSEGFSKCFGLSLGLSFGKRLRAGVTLVLVLPGLLFPELASKRDDPDWSKYLALLVLLLALALLVLLVTLLLGLGALT